jgi:hypothetical protein
MKPATINSDVKSKNQFSMIKENVANGGDNNYAQAEKRYIKVENKMIEQRTTIDTNSNRK